LQVVMIVIPSYLFHPLKQTDISFRDAMFIY